MRRSLLFFAFATTLGPAAFAKDLFVVVTTGAANLTASDSKLPGLISDAINAEGTFGSLGDRSFTLRLNYAGVADAIMLDVVAPQNGVGVYSATLTLPGFVRTFTANTKKELRDIIRDYLNDTGNPIGVAGNTSGHGNLLKSLKKIYASTPVTITDGTPQSSTAMVANMEFGEFGLRHALTYDERDALRLDRRPEVHAFSLESDYGEFDTSHGFHGSTFTLTPTLRLGDRWGFVFAMPLRLVEIEGARSAEATFVMGIPLQLVSQDKDCDFFWQVTPHVHTAIAGSFDMVQAAFDVGYGATHRIGYDFGFCTLQVANQFGVFTGVDVAGYNIGVEQQLMKNGVQLSIPVAGGWLLEGRAVRTDFLKEAPVPVYYTFGADLVFRTRATDSVTHVLVPDDLYVGVYCDTDFKSYRSQNFRAGVRWKW